MREQIREILTSCAHQFANSIKTRLDQAATDKTDGQRQVHVSPIQETVNTMSIEVAAGGLSTWIIEYGSGSRLDINSPYLQQYINSDMFNKARLSDGFAFKGRQKGDIVYNLDGTSYRSSGELAGKNLERMRNPYLPSNPNHVIEAEKDFIAPQIQQELSSCCLSALNTALLSK